MAEARAAIDDLEPYALGSFDDVVLAYDLGQLTDADYEVLILAGHPERDDLAPGGGDPYGDGSSVSTRSIS
jgi:hypothetical protein